MNLVTYIRGYGSECDTPTPHWMLEPACVYLPGHPQTAVVLLDLKRKRNWTLLVPMCVHVKACGHTLYVCIHACVHIYLLYVCICLSKILVKWMGISCSIVTVHLILESSYHLCLIYVNIPHRDRKMFVIFSLSQGMILWYSLDLSRNPNTSNLLFVMCTLLVWEKVSCMKKIKENSRRLLLFCFT